MENDCNKYSDTYVRNSQVMAKAEIFNLINKYLTFVFVEDAGEKMINRCASILQEDINEYLNIQRESFVSLAKTRAERKRNKVSAYILEEREELEKKKALEERDG